MWMKRPLLVRSCNPKTRDVLSENMEEKKCTISLQPDWKYSKSNHSLWCTWTPYLVRYLTLHVTWGISFEWNVHKRWCCLTLASQWPTHILLEWQQCVCVSLPHGREPAHTDTAMFSDGLTQRWEQLSERGLCCSQSKQAWYTESHVWIDSLHQQAAKKKLELASRWHCNIKAEASVFMSLCARRRKIHHRYETCQPHFSSQIREQIGGNERCTLIGDEKREENEESQNKCIL